MNKPYRTVRTFLKLLLLMLAPLLAQGQTTGAAKTPASAPQPPTAAATQRTEPKIERIHTEDSGAQVDELRVGGETQNITVQPKNDMPAYEVKPAEGARGGPPAASKGDTNGSRVWNFLKF